MVYRSELKTRRTREFGEVIGDAFQVFFVNIKNYSLGFFSSNLCRLDWQSVF